MPKVDSPPQGLTENEPFPPDCARRFSYTHKLGSGGFGAVFQALDRNLNGDAAVKLLFADLLKETDQVQRFTDEARITASLSHPHVVRVLDFGAEYGVPWIAFELIRGQNVRALLDAAHGGLTLGTALAVCIHVGRALEAAHQQGILHRDVKPDNVLEAAPGEFKITDFGIARWSGARAVKTATGTILGTPAYVAPELIMGDAPSPKSDVYALGVMLFELLTGEPPFSGATIGQLLEKHLRADVPAVTAGRKELPAALDGVLARALHKDPRERFSAAELVAELEALRAPGELASVTRMTRPSRSSGVTRDISRPVLSRSIAPAAAAPRRGWAWGVGACGLVALALIAWRRPVVAPAVVPGVASPVASAKPALDVLDSYRKVAHLYAQAAEIQSHIPSFNEFGGADTTLLAVEWVGRMAVVLERVHELVQPLLVERSREPELLMLLFPLDGILDKTNQMIQLLSPMDMFLGGTSKPHAIGVALHKWQKALAVQDSGGYAFSLRAALGPMLAIQARTAWGRSSFYTDSDAVQALMDAERRVEQIAELKQRPGGPYELLMRLLCIDHAADVIRDAKSPEAQDKARALYRRAFQISAQLETWERTHGPGELTLYRSWLDTAAGNTALGIQFHAAARESTDPSLLPAERSRGFDSLIALTRGRGFYPDFFWVNGLSPNVHLAVDRLVAVRSTLARTPAQAAALESLVTTSTLLREHFRLRHYPDATLSDREVAVRVGQALLDKFPRETTSPGMRKAFGELSEWLAAWRNGLQARR